MRFCLDAGNFVCRPKEYEHPLCIPMNATCNGIKDCPFGEDEETWCHKCATKHCDHSCENRKLGPHCRCDAGFNLRKDGISCEDIDECSTGTDSCQQLCENTVGSFLCKCASGYKLEEDGRSCRLEDNIDPEGYLLVSSNREVGQVPLPQYRNESVFGLSQKLTGKGEIKFIDYFRRENTIVMVIQATDGSMQIAVSKNQKLKIIRKTKHEIKDISVDWIGGNVFFIDDRSEKDRGEYVSDSISVCSLNSLFCRTVVHREYGTEKFHKMAVHPILGYIFWIYPGWERIKMSNTDGTNIHDIDYPGSYIARNEMTIDYIRNDLYFVTDDESIQRVNINTKGGSVVKPHDTRKPVDMVVFNGLLYWTEKSLKSINVFNVMQKKETIIPHFHFVKSITLNHSLYQPEPTSNPCIQLDCPWICVAVPGTNSSLIAKCLCPDGYEESPAEKTCIPPPTNNDTVRLEKMKSHVDNSLMAEYCKAGMACKNGGKCRKLFIGGKLRENRLFCECLDPYDGEFCERLNRKKLAEVDHGWNRLVLLVPIIILIAAGTLIFCLCSGKKAVIKRDREQKQEPICSVLEQVSVDEETGKKQENRNRSYDNPNYSSGHTTIDIPLQTTSSKTTEISH